MTLRASAPGKLMLIGEYAVLHGAPALVTAVDRRAEVTLTPASGPWHRLTAPPLGLARWPFRVDGGRLVPGAQVPAGVREKLVLFERIVELMSQTGRGEGAPLSPQHHRLDTSAFQDASGARKLGLGSSAALTVALVGGLRRLATGKPPDPDRLFPLAFRVHRAAQGERGSGFDVAAACGGGTLRYRIPRTADATPGEATPLGWPADLQLAVVWTGVSADTVSLTARVSAARQRDPGLEAAQYRLADLAQEGVAAFAAGQREGFLQAVRRYHDALAALGAAAGVGIVTPLHEQLAQAARARDVAYKPSGAGGGDIGVAFGAPEDVARFGQGLAALGAEAVSLVPDAPGFALEAASGDPARPAA